MQLGICVPVTPGGAVVVTGRSSEVAADVLASNAVRASTGWSWAAPFVHGTDNRNWIASGGCTSSA